MPSPVLVFRVGSLLCALPVDHVEEVLRPLPIEPLAGLPAFVAGASVLRGAPVPVLDMEILLAGTRSEGGATHLISLKTGDGRRVGILVSGLGGVVSPDTASFAELPPLLQDAALQGIERLASLDGRLLATLRSGSLVPEEVWQTLAGDERGR